MMISFSPQTGRRTACVSGILTALLAAVSCVSYMIKDYFIGKIIYVPTALACAGFVSFLFFSRRLWRRPDFLFVALFCLWNVVSIIVNVGFSTETILSFPVFDLVLIVSTYAVAVSADDPVRLMRLFAGVCAVLLALINLSVLGIATYSLLADVRVSDPTKWGCFLHERLSGAWNPNILACSCVVLLLCAVYAFRITEAKAGKAFYIAAGCIGAVNLSLTNSRTSMAAIGAAVGAWIFAALLRREYRTAFFRRITGRSVPKILFAAAAALGCAAAAFAVLLLPFFLYRALMQLADVFIDSVRLSIFLKYSLRNVGENMDTAGGRLEIWLQTIRDFLNGDTRRALFGISDFGSEGIAFVNVYGIRENQPHAHNMVLETLRRNGIPGVVLSLVPTVYGGVCGVKILFDRRRSLTEAIPLVLAFAILVIGLMEPVPFSAIYLYFVTLPFFFICGYAVRCLAQVRISVDVEQERAG